MAMVDARLAGAFGDGIHDDTAVIQKALDAAASGIFTGVFLPVGRYRTTAALTVAGVGVSLVGEGVRSVVAHDFHFHGQAGGGDTIWVMPQFRTPWLYPVEPVTADTITLSGSHAIAPGESLFLCNGRGGAGLAEAKMGGTLSPNIFRELAPCELVEVAQVGLERGRTIVTLKRPVIGANDYGNVVPTGAVAGERYLHIRRMGVPARSVTVANFAIDFVDARADCSVMVYYALLASINDITVLREPELGGRGGITVTGCMCSRVEKVYSSGFAGVSLNSSRCCQVERCNIHSVAMEECCTDNHVRGNFLRANGGFGVRTNDMPCQRNIIAGNTILGAAPGYCAVNLWEGLDNIVEGNIAALGDASIVVGGARGTLVSGNVATAITGYGTGRVHSGMNLTRPG